MNCKLQVLGILVERTVEKPKGDDPISERPQTGILPAMSSPEVWSTVPGAEILIENPSE
ncbi:MAG: hypothetical protein ACXACI_19095 [Candidatus Hodarchaeales archaeon]|jgi:hypothetical protein